MNKEILPFGEIWMDLEGVRLNEINQAEETTTVWYHLFVESKKKTELKEAEYTDNNQGQGGLGIGEILAKGSKLALRRYVSSGDLMYSIVIIVK